MCRTCKTSFPGTARLLERKSHCHKNSPSDLARHWLGWGADATLPIGGSTARVAPLSLLFSTAPRSHHRVSLPPSLSRARLPCVAPSYFTLTTGIRLSRFLRRVAIRFSRSARRPRRPLAPSRSQGVGISPTRSPLLPSPFHASRVPFLATAVSLSIAFDRAYISLMRLLSFFSPLSLPRPFSPRPSRSRAQAAKFGRTHAAMCLRHLVQCAGGEREEIPRRGSFLHER